MLTCAFSGFRMKQLELLPRPEVDEGDEEAAKEEEDRGMDRRVSVSNLLDSLLILYLI